ncbi:MAG: NAD regulator [Candidatus Lustribacter sp.]|jgi:hypothetical protein
MAEETPARLGIDAVVVGVRDDTPHVLTFAGGGPPRLPSAAFEPARDRTLELAARRVLSDQAGLREGYLEQLYTFGDRHRDPREVRGGPRFVSVGYLALTGMEAPGGSPAGGTWCDWYSFFPWEDARAGRPEILDRTIVPLLRRWIAAARNDAARAFRARVAFGLDGAPWNNEAVLERYECLYELSAAPEGGNAIATLGEPMDLDHRRIVATAIGRLRGKIKYRPVVFELIGATFTLSELQSTVEALAGMCLHAPNFRRLVAESGIVERTGAHRRTSGRPAEIYRFRPDVLAERPDPGIGIR